MANRRVPEAAPHLAWRVRLFSGAAILVVIGMYADLNWLIWGAVGLLAVAFALRFVGEGEAGSAEADVIASEDADAPETPDDEL
jgi:hypothetical protein